MFHFNRLLVAVLLLAWIKPDYADPTNTVSVTAPALTNAAAVRPVPPARPQPPKQVPTFADVAYGPDPRQKLDIYLPPGPGPFPIVMQIHGGGWAGGDKIAGAGRTSTFTNKGVAVVSIEYRFINDALREGISPPISAPLLDARRALQFVRYHAADYKLNADKIVVTGFSAGGTSSLFLAVEGEQANPNSPDPIERVSTKITAAVPAGAPTSFDPKQMDVWNPGMKWGAYLFESGGPTPNSKPDYEQFVADRDKWIPDFQKYSPDYLVSKDAPPIYLLYNDPLPLPGDQTPAGKTHSFAAMGYSLPKARAGAGHCRVLSAISRPSRR